MGAQRADVLKMVIGHVGKLLFFGAAIGLPVAFLCSWSLRMLLYQVNPFDLPIFAAVTGAVAVVALLASYIPAIRATRADPMIALSHNA